MSVPTPPYGRGPLDEHELPPHSIESVLATPMNVGLKPAAPIRMEYSDLKSMPSILYVPTQASPRHSPGLAMRHNDSQESYGPRSMWRGESTHQRGSSPELETGVSRTSSTSTKGSQDSAMDSSMALQLVSGMEPSAESTQDALPDDADSPKFRAAIGSVSYAPELSAMVWKIKQLGGGKEYLMRAHFGLPSVRDEESIVRRTPINVKFEIPYFTVSGVQVRYLKIVEKSGYQALRMY